MWEQVSVFSLSLSVKLHKVLQSEQADRGCCKGSGAHGHGAGLWAVLASRWVRGCSRDRSPANRLVLSPS